MLGLALALAMVLALRPPSIASKPKAKPFNYCGEQSAVFRDRHPFLGVGDGSVRVENASMLNCTLGQLAADNIGYFRGAIRWDGIEWAPGCVLVRMARFRSSGTRRTGFQLVGLPPRHVQRHRLRSLAGTGLAIAAIRGSSQIAHATGTRGAGSVFGALVLAGALGAAVALLTLRFGFDKRRVPSRIARPLTALCAVVVLIAAAATGPRLVSRAWHSFTRAPVANTSADPTARLLTLQSSRYPVWKSALKAFRARPAGGTGAGTFQFWWNEHGTTGEFVRDTHNIWLQNMAELGLPGLILIVAVAAAAVGLAVSVRLHARRGPSAGAAAALLAVMIVYLLHASVDWMWESTAVTVLALAGVAALGARLGGGPFRLPIAPRAALVAVAAVAAIVQLPGLMSTIDIRNSQAAERACNSGAALSSARSGVSAEPWSASAHEQEAPVLEADGQFRGAKQQESLAISRELTNYAHYLIRSRIETGMGELNAAVRDYSRAYRLRPNAAVFALAPYFNAT